MFATLALALLPALPAPPPAQDWLLVRGERRRVGTLTYERIGDLYLGGAPYRIVTADDADESPASHRLAIGSPSDNELVARLAEELGIGVEKDALTYAGQRCESGAGLVVVTSDVDGEGSLVLMTGVDPDGVYACFTTSINIAQAGWLVVRDRRIAASGAVAPRIQSDAPDLVRLDLDAAHLVEQAGGSRLDERALRVARGMEGYRDVLAAAGWPDPTSYATWLLGNEGRAAIALADRHFAKVDVGRAVLDAHRDCARALGRREGHEPVYYVLYGAVNMTNAKNFGVDPLTGRPRVLYNLPALTKGGHFRAALIHETVHTYQDLRVSTLLDRAIVEGVATYLTQAIDPSVEDVDAMLWSKDELRAARRHHDAIRAAFDAKRGSTNPSAMSPFTHLGQAPAEVPGAPSRTAYYLGWLASKAWHEANEGAELSELLAASAEEIWAEM